jgi:simple sugar transport system ATP-binding protein
MTESQHDGGQPPALLEVRGVTHHYGPVRALHDVSLAVQPGEVHALVGENGAGKSTLVKVIAGLVTPSAGEVLAGGAAVPAGRRRASVAAGIGVVHQHFSLVDSLTATENFLLGRPDCSAVLPLQAARAELAELGERIGLSVDPTVLVSDMTIGQRQRLEILTALGWGARMLLLDEPSAVLSPLEADALLGDLARLCESGFGFLLITHKLREVEEFADRVTVLRDGDVVGRHVGGASRVVLVEEMVGPGHDAGHRPDPVVAGPVRVQVDSVTAGRLRDVSLDLHAGVVVGVAGVVGSGQSDLIEVMSGFRSPDAGTVTLDGADITGNPLAAFHQQIALIPEDRERDALALELSVTANAVVKHQSELGPWYRLDRSAIDTICARVLERLGVQPRRGDLLASALSGGNQQRLVIGRELDRAPGLVLAAEPTRGLDPPSTTAVIDGLRQVAAAGAAVLVVASDLDELFLVADRLVVMCDGRITLDVDAASATRHDVGRAMVAVPA